MTVSDKAKIIGEMLESKLPENEKVKRLELFLEDSELWGVCKVPISVLAKAAINVICKTNRYTDNEVLFYTERLA